MAVIREQLTRESSIVAFIISNRMIKHDMRPFTLILNDLLFFLIHHCIVCLVVKDWEMFRSGRNFIPKWECQLDTPRTERIFQNGPKSSRFNLTGKLCNILCISPFYMWCALYRSGMSILCEEVGSKLIMYVHSYCHTEWTYELN